MLFVWCIGLMLVVVCDFEVVVFILLCVCRCF